MGLYGRGYMAGSIRIGTSGWHYKHWIGRFYPEKLPASRMLEFYTRHFDSVEINNSFYRLPPENGLIQWRDSTPDGFCFAMKGSRFLTHMKKLADTGPGIEKFFARAWLLGEKLGPVLFQLPPQWEKNAARLEAFLEALPGDVRYAFEFRNRSWDSEEIFGILRAHNAAYCIYDLAGFLSPLEITADFTYVRLHGPGGKYQGSYSDEVLERWAKWLRSQVRSLRGAYVYFDNDEAGYAAGDAVRLRGMI